MIVGDPQDWKNHFVTVDERVLQRVLHLWPLCVGLLPRQPEEDTITINLVDLLCKDAVMRRICHFVAYQHEPFGTHPDGAKFSKGKIDIAILFDQERERYIAYECKRLNVIHSSRASLATPYVKDGMMRFLTEQYAAGLPVGCMLGYVMDGDLPFAVAQINAAIEAEKLLLGLASGPNTGLSIPALERFSTTHSRSTNAMLEMRHALLPFSHYQVCKDVYALTEPTAR